MTEMSPQISFAEYHTYQVSDNGALVAPVTNPDFVCLARSYNRYLYAFADGLFPGATWGHVQTYKLFQLSTPQSNQMRTEAPWVAPALDKSAANSETSGWGTELASVQLPRTIDGQVEGIRYFFVMTRWPLLPKTIAEIARLGPDNLLPASLPVCELSIDGRHQKLLSIDNGKIEFVARDTPPTTANYPTMFASARRYVFVVDVYTIAEHLAASLDANMTKLARFVDPASAADAKERTATELRLARYEVAREIDTLRKAGAKLDDSQLATMDGKGRHKIEDVLKSMDPSNQDEGLGRLLWLRDRASRVLLQWLQSPLWDLLCKDARDTPQRAKEFYERHLVNALYCMEPLARTPEGSAYFMSLYEQCLPSKQKRTAPKTSIEFIAQNIIFVESRDPGSWEEYAAVNVARSIYALYVDLAPVMAKYSLERLASVADVIPDSETAAWAKNPLQTKMGATAFRWAYHLRNNFKLKEVRAGDTGQVVVFTSAGEGKSFRAFEIDISWNGTEWVSRLGGKSPAADVLWLGFNLVGAVFSTGALVEALSNERHRDTAFLKTASAYMSLGQSSYVQKLLGQFSTLAATKKGLTAVKVVGLAGAALGAWASLREAANLQNDFGETAAAWVTGVSGVGAAFVAGWASLASLGYVASAPSGWWILGGAALIVGGVVIVEVLKDSELQRVVNHSVFGNAPGEDHEAPGMSLCRTGRFAEWAGGWNDLSIIRAQRDALHGVARAFGVRGLAFVHDYPKVQFVPQSLLPESILEVSVVAVWTTPQGIVARQFRGDGQLHVGHDKLLRMDFLSGDAFETDRLNGVRVIGAVMANGARCIDWIFAPNAAFRAATSNLLLTSVTLQTRLWITGLKATAVPSTLAPSIVVPVPRHGDPAQFLTYELVVAAPNAPSPATINPLAVPAAIPVAMPGNISTVEKWSTSAYPPP